MVLGIHFNVWNNHRNDSCFFTLHLCIACIFHNVMNDSNIPFSFIIGLECE